MKKILLIILILISLGCERNLNTPTESTEEYISNYQNLSDDVVKDIEKKVNDEDLTEKDKKRYKSLIEKQYQNLSYKITNEEIIEDKAIVDLEIEVLNYGYSLNDSKKYYEEHKEEIEDYNEYRLNQLEKVTDKIKYKITISLTKYDGIWKVDKIDDNTLRKLQGLY